MYPIASGQIGPPMLPAIFIAPESDPACLPPMSMHVAYAPDIAWSLQKLAMPMASTASSGRRLCVESARKPLAPANPMYAITRRQIGIITIVVQSVDRNPLIVRHR